MAGWVAGSIGTNANSASVEVEVEAELGNNNFPSCSCARLGKFSLFDQKKIYPENLFLKQMK